MKWYDQSVDSKMEEDQEHPSLKILPLRPGDEIGSSFYASRDTAGRVTSYDKLDCDDYREGDRIRRSKVEQDFVRGSMADEDVVVHWLVGDVLRKQSATQRHPSKAGSATRRTLSDTVKACNSLAMSALGRGEMSRCKGLLTRALEMTSGTARDQHGVALGRGNKAAVGIPSLQVLTLNNMACLHRRLGEPKQALRFLRRAADVGRMGSSSEHLDVTHLNACAVLSELGWHEEALEHARSAIYHGQKHEETGTHPVDDDDCSNEKTRARVRKSRRARVATLAVSYYNLAVELEYTHRYEACLRWYREAVKLARDPDVRNEKIIRTFQRAYAGARKKHLTGQLRSAGNGTSPDETPLARRTGGRASGASLGSTSPSRVHCDPLAHSGDGVRRVPQEACGDLSGSKKSMGLPRLGKIDKQQIGSDERQSMAVGDWNSVRTEKASKPSESPQSGVGGTRLRKEIASSRSNGSSPSECVGETPQTGRGSSVKRPESRKRPASAGGFSDPKPKHVQLGKTPDAVTIPDTVDPSWNTLEVDKAGNCRNDNQSEIAPEESIIRGGCLQVRNPRLGEGNRLPDASLDITDRGCGRSGDKNLSPKSWSASFTSGDRVGDCQSPGKMQVSRVGLESSKVSGRQEGISQRQQRQCNGLTTELQQIHGGSSDNVNARNSHGCDNNQESLSSPSSPVASGEVSRPRKRLSMEVARAASYSANESFFREKHALKDKDRPTDDCAILDEFVAKPSSTRNGVDSWTNVPDGKSHVDLELQEADKPLTHLRVEDTQSGEWRKCANQQEEYSSEITAVHGHAKIRQKDDAPRPNTASALVDGDFTRKQGLPSENYGGTGDAANDRQELDCGSLVRNGRATESMSGIVSPKGEGVMIQALGMTNQDALQEEDKKQGGCITASPVAIPEDTNFNTATQKRRDSLTIAQDRRKLAGSAIRAWVARAILVRRIRRRRPLSELKLRWECEVHRIAATRIQSVMRGMICRRELERALRAAINIQRVTRRRQGGLAAKRLLAQKRLEEQQEASRNIQRVFRGYRNRRRMVREKQISWEAAIVYHGAAMVIQGFWHRHRHAAPTPQLEDGTQRFQKKSNLTPSVKPALLTPSPHGKSEALAGAMGFPTTGNSSSSQVTCCETSSVLDAQPATPEVPSASMVSKASEGQQPWRPTETEVSSLYVLWGAFTALLTTSATRRAVKQRLVSTLLAPATATLAAFSRVHQSSNNNNLEDSSPFSPTANLTVPPDPMRFQCARGVRKELDAASRRLAAVARVHTESLSAAQSAATDIFTGLSSEKREATRNAVVNAVQDCWGLLCSRDDLLENGVQEKLTDVLLGTLKDLFAHLGFISLQASSTGKSFPVERLVKNVEYPDGDARTRPTRRNHLKSLPETFARALASSTAGTLLSQSDVSDILDDATDDFDDAEHASLVAEAYGILLLTTAPDCGSKEEHNVDLTPVENNDGFTLNVTMKPSRSGAHLQQPPHYSLRVHERMDVLHSIFRKIDATADELTRAIEASPRTNGRCYGSADPGAGKRADLCSKSSPPFPFYDEHEYLIRSMTEELWKLALTVSPLPICHPHHGEEIEAIGECP